MSLEPPAVAETENAVPLKAAPELRTPAEWSALDGVTVMDPDGWRGSKQLPAKSFDEPIDRDEWEGRLSLSTQSLRTTQPEDKPLSVVDRIALRMLCTKVCGATSRQSNVAEARELWRTTPEHNREAWRREARALLADIALGDNDEMRAWPEYQVRHPDGDAHDAFDDIGSAVDFADHVWPGSTVFERTRMSVCTEWTEVPA